jgi:hypothetical protein
VRPAAATDPVTSQTAPLGSDSSEEATVRRAASTADAQALPAPVPASASPLARPAVLWGLVAGVVVLVGLVVFLVVRPGSDDPAPAMPKPSATVSMPGDDSAIGDGVFDKPTVSARSGTGNVSFTWNYPQPTKKDTFRVSYGPTPSDAGNPERAKLVSVSTRSYTVTAPKGTKVCATVVVARSGQASPGSDVQCETAQ